MRLTGKIADISVGFCDNITKLTLAINEKNDLKAGYDELKDIEKLDIEIKKHRKKRSLNANNYLWQLCGKLAEKIGCGDLDVYRQHILNAGVCRPVEVNEAAANTLVTSWSSHGIGWLAERLDYGAHEGFVLFHLYYGSSTYDTKQMSRLLDSVIEDCKEQGIQTLTPNEIARMKATWRAERI